MTVALMSQDASHDGAANAQKLDESLVYSRMDRELARRFVQDYMRRRAQRYTPVPGYYRPRMDLYDDEDEPLVFAMVELPYVNRDRTSVQVRDGKLVIHGERESPLITRLRERRAGPLNSQRFKTRELKFGIFHREIDLPEGTQTDDVTAEMFDGMLYLSWPRRPGVETNASALRPRPQPLPQPLPQPQEQPRAPRT